MGHRGIVAELILRTSKRGLLWSTARYKDLIDSLTRIGSLNDPRVKCSEMAGALEEWIEFRDGRYRPRKESPLSPHDDKAIRVLRVHRVPRGSESIKILGAKMPATTRWLEHPVPYFGTNGKSIYEAQTQLNREALSGLLRFDRNLRSLGVSFTLSLKRTDRDLDNLFDALVPLFNRLYPSLEELVLVKEEPLRDGAELVRVLA